MDRNNLALVDQSSVEWDIISVYLSLCVRTSKISLLDSWQITIPDLHKQFETRSFQKLVLPIWIPVCQLQGENSIEDVVRRGFVLDDYGLLVQYGALKFPDFSESNLPDKAQYEFLFCDVCVGVSYSLPSVQEEPYFKQYSLPKDYDSLIMSYDNPRRFPQRSELRKPPLSGSLTSKTHTQVSSTARTISSIHHSDWGFKIFDSTQIYPRYLCVIECRYDTASEANDYQSKLCDHCGENPRSVHCLADDIDLCVKCDECLHTGNKILERHTRRPYNKYHGRLDPGQCAIHPLEQCGLFCTICELAVCNLCRSYHYHESPSGSVFCTVDEGYSSILDETFNSIAARKAVIQQRVADIDALIGSCRESRLTATRKVATIISKSVDQLTNHSETTIGSLLANQMESHRSLQLLNRGDSFLKYMKSVLPPADYLRAWLSHCKLMKHLYMKGRIGHRPDSGEPIEEFIRHLRKLTGNISIHV